MKKKLLSLLMAATMVGSMAGATTVFAEEADTTEDQLKQKLPQAAEQVTAWKMFQSQLPYLSW